MGFVTKIIEFLENGVKCVFVFDGQAPDAKKETLDKRSDVRQKMNEKVQDLKEQKKVLSKELPKEVNIDEYILSDDETDVPDNIINLRKINKEIDKIQKNILHVYRSHSIEVMELLQLLGIPFFKAPGDAEQACAYLQKKDIVDHIMTEDTDTLVFGAREVIFGNKLYNLDKVLSELKMDYSQFVDFCILCGCDYTCTIPKIGPVTALQIIRKYISFEEFCNVNTKYTIPENFDILTSREIFKNECIHLENTLTQCRSIKEITEYLLKNDIPDFFINKLINLINF